MEIFYTCALLAILTLTSWANESTLARFREDRIKCEEESGIDVHDLARFYEGGMNPADTPDAVKCFFKCIMEKDGMFKNGKFDEQGFAASVKGYNMAGIKKVGICKLEKGANDCETAFKITMCFMHYDKSSM